MDVVSILRKMRQDVTGYELEVVGERQDEHPEGEDHHYQGRARLPRAGAEAGGASSAR